MKRIFVQLAGAESQPVEISIMPGVTAGELVRELELFGCVLFRRADPSRFFAGEEVIYDELTEGETLIATVSAEVAQRYLRSLLI